MNAYRKTLVDNIYKDSAYLAYLRMVGAIDRQNGGERIQIPLMYGVNDTIKTHGNYSVIDVKPQEGLTSAFYEWAEVAGSISISRLEERKNAGEGKLIGLLKSKIKQAEMQMTEKLNGDLVLGTISGSTFVPDTADDGAYGLLPLGYFLRQENATDPTTHSVGNISSSSYDWWRHNTASLGAGADGDTFNLNVSTYKGLVVALRRMYNWCSRGTGGAPDLVVADQVTFETYENALDEKVRYMNTKMADMGFDNIKIRGATILWDEKVPNVHDGSATMTTGTDWFLNTKFYNLIIDSETDIITTPFIEPENQTAKTAKILFMGNATCSNLRKQGCCFEISQSIVA